MKRTIYLLLPLLLIAFQAVSQVYEPVKWKFDHKLVGDDKAELTFSATIEDKWHVYSTKLADDLGPVPSAVDFLEINGAELVGDLKESETHTEFDPVFQAKLTWFEHKAVIKQMVKLTAPMAKIKGELTYMTCDDSKCLPPEYLEFEFDIEAALKPASKPAKEDPSKTANNEQAKIEPAKEVVEAATIEEHKKEEPEIYTPVAWSFELVEKGDGLYTLIATATIDEHWHVYSKDLPSEDGPIATEFNFTDGSYELVGDLREKGDLIQEYDPNFMMDLSYYSHKMVMEQDFKINGDQNIVGEIYFMTCDAEKCLPPKAIEFEIDAQKKALVQEETISNSSEDEANSKLKIPTIDLDSPLGNCGTDEEESTQDSGLLTIFFLGFIGGLVALLTPCVFPMIPLTVSFFTKSSENKRKGMINAFLYGFSIFMIYVLLSTPFHLLDSVEPEILNNISTNAWLNLAFFAIFVFFAFSFFGYFELTLPSNMANRVDSASNLGGLLGIFFMALTLAIVSFSCTGPILGSLLAGSLSSDGGAWQLTTGMAGFGLALALPFGLFAAFPSWLNSLPKSGGWLNSVKVVLGFVEVALAIKFLSNADLVEHWGILKIEAFLAIWIICGLGIGAYLMGWINFPHDSKNRKPSKLALVLATVTFAFVIYLGSGFRYNERSETFVSLELLSGIAPSAGYSWIHPSQCPLGLECFHDYDEGLEYAKSVNKPILLDFTGYACVNCRKMEETVWPVKEIYDLINEEYVLISLYVDDRKELPENEKFEFVNESGKKKKIKTYGDKWATLETQTFRTNAQPHYALISPDQKLLNSPVGYTPDVKKYESFLRCGIETFKKESLK